jgi:glycosyltransferase involved in cell wall biosynthesis
MGKILTVCIPTFNRSDFIKKQLAFFQGQIKKNEKIIEQVAFIVADHASTDNTAKFLSQYRENNTFFEYIINPSNLGLTGNIGTLLNASATEYVWFVSDDDELKDGVVEEVIKIINQNNHPEFIFLNYSFSGKKGFNGKSGYRPDSQDAALEVFQEAYGSLVFMTACVYKRRNLLELSQNKMFMWLSAPMLYSFYSCAKGPVFLSEDYWIYFNPDNASYAGLKRVLKLKFEEYIAILESLVSFGYNEKSVKKTISVFFECQSHAHFLYNFINFKHSIPLYKHYSLRAVIKIPKNIMSFSTNYIKRYWTE